MIELGDIEDVAPMEGEIPEIELPFGDEKSDVGEWVYLHYVGIIAAMSLYLVVMVALIVVKIVVEPALVSNVVQIDLEQIEQLKEERDRLAEEVEQKQIEEQIEWEEVQNQISNESSLEAERIESDIEEMIEAAAEQQRVMAENRAAYERGLAEAQELIDNPPPPKPFLESQLKPRRDIKVGGKVTVSYTLNNPVRHARELVVPSYLCEGGGEVSIRIGVDQKGEVVIAKVIRGGDECQQQAALNSALASRFEINRGAPYRHMGLIIYTFVPQGGVSASTLFGEE